MCVQKFPNSLLEPSVTVLPLGAIALLSSESV